jgi:hypothetical protein
VCTGIRVHHEQTARQDDAGSVVAYAGTPQASSHVELKPVARPAKRMQRVRTGTSAQVHYEQAVRACRRTLYSYQFSMV